MEGNGDEEGNGEERAVGNSRQLALGAFQERKYPCYVRSPVIPTVGRNLGLRQRQGCLDCTRHDKAVIPVTQRLLA